MEKVKLHHAIKLPIEKGRRFWREFDTNGNTVIRAKCLFGNPNVVASETIKHKNVTLDFDGTNWWFMRNELKESKT